MDYLRVTISTTDEGVDLVAGALSAIGIDQVEIIEGEETIRGYLDELSAQWDYVDPSELVKEDSPCVRVYLPMQGQVDEAEKQVRARIGWLGEQDFGVDLGALEVRAEVVREQDWANNWKQYFVPTRIGRSIVVKPSWEEYAPQPGDKVLCIDPGMAFGTGTHETTALCIEAIEEFCRPGYSALDIGCGSGILSIAAVLCGAAEVTAIDIDPVAVQVAQENIALNGMQHIVDCRQADLLAGQRARADIVVANIVADAIVRLTPAAFAHTNDGGTFIASGIIDEREDEVLGAAQRAGFIHERTYSRGSWRAIAWRRG